MPDLQYMWYGTKPSLTFNISSFTQIEDFEDGTYNSFFTVTNPSTMAGTEAGWLRTTAKSYTGTGSFTNQDIASVPATSQEARVDFTFTIPTNASNIRVDYYYYQDCEENYDGLRVYLDDTLINNHIPGGTYRAWTLGSITGITPGTHKLTFEYRKDGQTDKYTDSVYIDDLKVSYDIQTLTETPGTEIVRFDGSTGYSLLYHRVGAQAPPLVFIEQRVPFQPGSMLQYTDILPRDVELGILVKGTSKADLRDKVRNLANKIINVDGVLYAKYTDGTERRLYCRYMSGMEGEEKPETMGRGYFQKMILVFRAFDPFWYSTGGMQSTMDNNLHPYTNNGAYEAYPIVYVQGPVTNPDIVIWPSGQTEPSPGSGKRLKINYSVPSGKKLIVDMKKRTVKLDDGTNVYSYIDATDNKFNSIPNDGATYYVDVDHSGTQGTVRYYSYVAIPHWGV